MLKRGKNQTFFKENFCNDIPEKSIDLFKKNVQSVILLMTQGYHRKYDGYLICIVIISVTLSMTKTIDKKAVKI